MSFLQGDFNCDYCGEPFLYDKYTITLLNNENYGSFCSKECRLTCNRMLGPVGTDRWKEREKLFEKEHHRRVNLAPGPGIIKDKRKTCRNQWLPKCWEGLTEQEMKIVDSEINDTGENNYVSLK